MPASVLRYVREIDLYGKLCKPQLNLLFGLSYFI